MKLISKLNNLGQKYSMKLPWLMKIRLIHKQEFLVRKLVHIYLLCYYKSIIFKTTVTLKIYIIIKNRRKRIERIPSGFTVKRDKVKRNSQRN